MAREINRRAFCAAAGALLGGCAYSSTSAVNNLTRSSIIQRAAQFQNILSLGELQQRRDRLLERFPELFTRQIIGTSRQDRPIELVTIGEGSYSALLVAGVHANEPHGNLAADVLMHELAQNGALREQLNTSWRFINPIDPDGLLLNGGWFSAPHNPEGYFNSFFRPALARQPDYTFPMRVGAHAFDDQSPESQAFQAAIDIARPDLLLPMHNCEFGGTFFLLSQCRPELEDQLRSLAALLNLPLSTIGEPLSGFASCSQGVFELPRPHSLIQAALEQDVDDLTTVWPAGGSSTEYAERYGTFSLVTETPLWQTSTRGAERWTLSQVLDEHISVLQITLAVLEKWAPTVLSRYHGSEIGFALAEQLAAQRTQSMRLPQVSAISQAEEFGHDDTISIRVQLGLFALRGPALLLRLVEAMPEHRRSRAKIEIRDLIRSQLLRIDTIATLEPTHLPSMVALQALACMEGVVSVRT